MGDRNRAAYMRAYRARKRLEARTEPAPLHLAADASGPGDVEAEVRAKLTELGSSVDRGLAVVAVALAQMMDRPAERSANVAAQLRLVLQDIRNSAASSAGTGRLQGLRSSVAAQQLGLGR